MKFLLTLATAVMLSICPVGATATELSEPSAQTLTELREARLQAEIDSLLEVEFSKLEPVPLVEDVERSLIVEEAKRYRGVPYVYGANGPKAFDCSGFTKYVYNRFATKLPRTAYGQYKHAKKTATPKPGDLVFMKTLKKGPSVTHVGMVTEVHEDGSFTFIHASCSRGVTLSRSTENYYRTKIVGTGEVYEA